MKECQQPSPEAAKPLPIVPIDVETRHVKLEGWKKPKKVRGEAQWDALLLFGQNAGERLSGKRIKEATGHPAGDVVWLMRRFFDDVKDPKLITTAGFGGGKGAAFDAFYQFNGDIILIGDPQNTAPKEREPLPPLYLPDGQIVTFHKNVRQQMELLRLFLSGPHPIPGNALAEALYGKDKKTSRDNTVKIISALNRQLVPLNWRISQIVKLKENVKNQTGAYQLGQIVPDTSLWGQTLQTLWQTVPQYAETCAPYTEILKDFWQRRLRIASEGWRSANRLMQEFEEKYPPEIIDLLAPALKKITALVTQQAIYP